MLRGLTDGFGYFDEDEDPSEDEDDDYADSVDSSLGAGNH